MSPGAVRGARARATGVAALPRPGGRHLLGRVLPLVLPLLFVALVWEACSRWAQTEEMPGLAEIGAAFVAILGSPRDLAGVSASLWRMAAGFALGLAIAVPVGLAMGRSPALARALNPITTMVYPVPKAALMPIIMLWFGIGDLSKVLVIFLGVSLPLLYHSYQGARSVDEKLVWSARAMGMRAAPRLVRIVLPGALPEVLLGCRVGIAMALITMVSSEMIARQDGAGELLFNALDMAVYPEVYAMILLIALIGLGLDFGFERLRRWLVRWSDTLQANDA
ncbi:MAG: ABC transporter permease [Pigmentiphaga sp.]